MQTVISLLRGINVGGHKKIKMADLRALYQSLGLRDTRTVLQSGNAVFATEERDLAALQNRIKARIHSTFGFDVAVILRRSAAFKSTLETHPFTVEQLKDAKKAVVIFLSVVPDLDAVERLREENPGREYIHADGSELFVFYTDGQARSKLDNNRIETALSLKSTARNWNTCGRILKLLEAFDA